MFLPTIIYKILYFNKDNPYFDAKSNKSSINCLFKKNNNIKKTTKIKIC